MEPGIVVTGRGEVSAAPDLAVLSLGVSVKRPSAPAAISDAAAAAARLIDAIAAAGVDRADVRTASFTVSPEYSYPPSGTPIADGYRVNNELSVTVRAIDGVGDLIDAATSAAGDDAVVHGLSFQLADDAVVRDAAREAAFGDARRSAEQLAALAGRRLGRVESVAQVTSPGGPAPMLAKAAFDVMSTPISPGEIGTAVSVEVRWSFAD